MTAEIEGARKNLVTQIKNHAREGWRWLARIAKGPDQSTREHEYILRARYNKKVDDARHNLLIYLRDLKSECIEHGWVAYRPNDLDPDISIQKYCQGKSVDGITTPVDEVWANIVCSMVEARIKPNDYRVFYDLEYLLVKEDRQSIIELFHKRVKEAVTAGIPSSLYGNEEAVLAKERSWLEKWQKELKIKSAQETDISHGFFLKRGVERVGKEFKEAGRVNAAAKLVLNNTVKGSLRFGEKELVKGLVSTSGLVGLVGGGFAGTMIAGAFVGAASGVTVEYIKQVSSNLDKRVECKQEADLALAEGGKSILRKMRELRHAEVLKPNDYRKIAKAAVFGAGAGALGGLFIETLKDHGEDIKSLFSGMGRLTGLIEIQEAVKEATPESVMSSSETNEVIVETGNNIKQETEEVVSPGKILDENTSIQNKVDTVFGVYGDVYTLKSGDSVVGIAHNLAKGLAGDEEPSNKDVFSIAKRIALDNNIRSDFLGTTGSADAYFLRAGEFKLNLTGTKTLAKEIVRGGE